METLVRALLAAGARTVVAVDLDGGAAAFAERTNGGATGTATYPPARRR